MAPRRFCHTCNQNTEVEHDDAMGHVVCTGCGEVMEQNTIVSEVGFMENSKGAAMAEGFSMGKDKARVTRKAAPGAGNQRSMLGGAESRETTIANGHKRIQDISFQPQIKMRGRQIEQAQRIFNLAVSANFTKGRKLNNVAAACLYIVARTDKTAHMLIDFADALSTNVYQLGAAFMKLVRILGMDLPIVDPSLYISRFAARLEFEELTTEVTKEANRMVQRLNRDWIQQGRRPAGICAAALFIAARMHGFNRTKKEIAQVVKICEATVQKRLREFTETPSANLTVEQFGAIWLPQSANPPAFGTVTKRPAPDSGEPDPELEVDPNPEVETGADPKTNESNDNPAEEAALIAEMTDVLENPHTISVGGLQNTVENEDEDLTHLDDDPEIQIMLDVTQEEIDLKEGLWITENSDWIRRAEEKAKKAPTGPKAKRKKTKQMKKTLPVANSPAEAARNFLDAKPRTSSKINYAAIDDLFKLDLDDIERRQASIGKMVPSANSVTGFGRQAAQPDDDYDEDLDEY
ncbi:transcription factor TFIIIB subunit brf1 [Thoreauomyces humboldtii]|nr:transcription factor TFIIIB subunit brf1 [Thoreauomyces humboldtii]